MEDRIKRDLEKMKQLAHFEHKHEDQKEDQQ